MRNILLPLFGAVIPNQGGRIGAIMRGAAADGSGDYAIIVPDTDGAEIESAAWASDYIDVPAAKSKTDGQGNTQAMADAGLDLAKRITALQLHDHQDWYLPAMAELHALHANVPELFNKDGWYWSSSQYSRNCAWCQAFEYGISSSIGKGNELRARPVRKIPLSHFNA
ncbi:DUF1566 domain-containing protein [Comamonas odontotermitis]|uniref:Lcl C-terminal domain-containing protein n=1 Tax=Comamonas odontotermitis TaxID=379895 RepID=UPI00366F6FE7